MTDAIQYSLGAEAKMAGLPYDPSRDLDWRMGWLATWCEENPNIPGLPDDWADKVIAYRKAFLTPTGTL